MAKVKARMRYDHKKGKLVKVDMARSAALSGRKRKRMSDATKAKIGKAVRRAYKKGQNKWGHPVRKWGRPAGSKSSRPRKVKEMEAPKKSRKAKSPLVKLGRTPEKLKAPKSRSPEFGTKKRGRKPKAEMEAPKRGRKPKAVEPEVKRRKGPRVG